MGPAPFRFGHCNVAIHRVNGRAVKGERRLREGRDATVPVQIIPFSSLSATLAGQNHGLKSRFRFLAFRAFPFLGAGKFLRSVSTIFADARRSSR